MNKEDFLRELAEGLSRLGEEELNNQLAYYGEMIEDMREDGLSEEEAVRKLGRPGDIAREILEDMPLGALARASLRPRRGWTAPLIILAVLGFPLWFSLLLAGAALAFSVFVGLWALVFSLFVTALALGAGGIYMLVRSAALFSLGGAYTLLAAGAGLLLLSLLCLFTVLAKAAAVRLWALGRRAIRALKAALIKKEV